ncbi:MAG: PIN domain-containing protein [Myxococcota bacterium]
MNVLVDTSVWSLALRRKVRRDAAIARELTELVREGRILLPGPVRQELLSGVKETRQFSVLRDRLRAFPDLATDPLDYEEAAVCFNRCRAKGIQGSNTDFLLCALAIRRSAPIFTTDRDFEHFGTVLPIVLHQPRAAS